MQVVRDEPGRLIHLEHVGARLTRRHGAILLILGIFWAAPLLIAWAESSSNTDTILWRGVCALVVWYVLLAPISVSILRRVRHVQAVRVDRARGTWTIVERRLWALQDESFDVPSPSIEWFTVRNVEGGWRLVPGALSLEVRLHPSERTIALELEWVDRFEEVLDLAFRLGAASGMTHFRIFRSTLTEFAAEVSRESSRGMEPIPRIDAPADYEQEVSAAEERVDRPGTPPFATASWKEPFAVQCWEPGRLVVFHQSANYATLGCVTALLSPFLLGGLMPLWMGITDPDRSALGFAAVWYALLFVILWAASWGSHGATTLLDWRRRCLRTRTIFGSRSAPLDTIRRIDVLGVRWHKSEGEDGPMYAMYKCQVLAVCQDGEGSTRSIRLTETQGAREDPDSPYRTAWPLGEALAEALHVPARYKDYRTRFR